MAMSISGPPWIVAIADADTLALGSSLPPASSLPLKEFFVADGGVGGAVWESNGVRWRPKGGTVLLKSLITPQTNSGIPKVVMDACEVKPWMWQDGDFITIEANKTREGGVADTDATDFMVGTSASVLGTSTGYTSSALATTVIQYAWRHRLRRESATSVRTLSIAGGGGGLGTASTLNTLTTGLTDFTANSAFFQVTSDLSTAGGETVFLRAFNVWLHAGS